MGFLSSNSAEKTTSPNRSPDIEQFSDPTTAHIETSSTPQKWHLSSKDNDGDTALALFSNPEDLHEAISSADERALQWKIDLTILPYLAVCYAFFYIDKTTLSYAAIFGIKDDLNLVGTEYSWLSSIFYFGFLAWACK
jgi:MFS transporter, ACS family, DAL5 transporter family protein